jgi:flagellin
MSAHGWAGTNPHFTEETIMGMSINTNLSALNTYQNLNKTQNDLSSSLEKLSSGLRINRAADDAAGLSISEGLKSQVGGLTVAARNAQDGISVVQTAEGGLTEVHSILQRMRDLAVQAGNDSNNADSRTAIKTEVTSLQSELSRIASSTNFNGTSLLNSSSTLKFQVGANGDSNSQIAVDLSGANVSKVVDALGATQSDGTTFTIASGTDLNTDVKGKTMSFEAKNGTSSDLTITTGTLQGSGTGGNFTSVDDLVSSLNGDATFSKNFTATAVKDANGATTGFNVRANDGSTVDTTSPLGATDTDFTGAAGSSTTGLQFDTADHAQAAIRAIDEQITAVSTARSNLGAIQNRFDHAINVTNTTKENLTAAESRITDVDMASEMVNYTRDNILSQAGTAMLSQANQSTQSVLSLLK